MSKPKPHAEIVIKNDSNWRLLITTNSADAYNFVKLHAPEFGLYFEPSEIDPLHILYIRAGYDANEVAAYLQAMEDESE